MDINKMKSLKVGDVVVQVRTHYQNYDHTKVPCEPKVYTISWTGGSEVSFKETVKRSFIIGGTRMVNAYGCSRSQLCDDFVTLEDYLGGEYNKGIVLDKTRWKSLEEFLLYKMENDHKIARKAEDDRVAKEDSERKKAQ